MNKLLKQMLLVCVCFFALTGQAIADSLEDAKPAYDTANASPANTSPSNSVSDEQTSHASSPNKHGGLGCMTDNECEHLIEYDTPYYVVSLTPSERIVMLTPFDLVGACELNDNKNCICG